MDKAMYQRRRADLGRLAEKLDADIAELEQKLKDAETMKDDNLSQALSVMKKYSGADELTQAMVQELIEKVVVTDPEHVEIVWKFKDEVRYFIGMQYTMILLKRNFSLYKVNGEKKDQEVFPKMK